MRVRVRTRLAVTAVTAVFAVPATALSQGQPPASRQLGAQQMRDDLAAFRSRVFERDNSYTPDARAEAAARLGRLESNVERMSLAQFALALAQVVALADNGHTNAVANIRARQFNRIPARLAVFEQDFRVIRATEANADLLGARLVSIDGHAVAELSDSARTLSGGIPSRRDRLAAPVLESPAQLHALGLARDSASATYVFQTLDGRTIQRRLGDEPNRAPDARGGVRLMFPALLPDEEGKWRTLLASGQAPWSLQEPELPFRVRAAPEIDGMVVELRQTNNAPGHPIREFLAATTTRIREQQPRNLVIDLRLNGGGNLNTARDFMKSLPALVPGRIFVLTSPWTFSAAISSLGYLEQTAPDRVTIVGEEVGDRLEFWAEGGPTTLPASGLMFSIATERHDYKNGCRAFTDCHGPVVANPIAVPSLAPDVAAPWTIEAYRAGRDPAMDAVAAQLRR